MTPKSKSPSKRRADGTVKKLAQSLGVSQRRCQEQLAAGMPDDLEGAKAWRAERAGNRDTSDELRASKIRLLNEQEERLKLQNAAARNELISRAEIHEMFVALGSAINAFCERASREIPSEVLGLPIEKSLPKSRAKMRELQTLLADRQSEFWKSHPTKSDELTESRTSKRKSKP